MAELLLHPCPRLRQRLLTRPDGTHDAQAQAAGHHMKENEQNYDASKNVLILLHIIFRFFPKGFGYKSTTKNPKTFLDLQQKLLFLFRNNLYFNKKLNFPH